MAMNRRTRLKMAGPAVVSCRAQASSSSRRPNILILITDHLFSEALSCRIGDRFVKTPNMDSVASNGMFLTRAYCANPLCMPSRTSMFTGRYPAETGVEINDPNARFSPGWTKSVGALDPQKFSCMGTLFQHAGYETGYFGK